MVSVLLLLLLLDDGPAAPPGTVLPNKEALLKTFREQHAKWDEPLDNFVRREVYPGKKEGYQEAFIQMNGDYCKAYLKDHLGVERLVLLNPDALLSLIKVPYEPGWKLTSKEMTSPKQRAGQKRVWKSWAWMFDDGGVDWGLRWLMANPPQAKVTKVTAERAEGVPVYRFHFTTEQLAPEGEIPNGTRDSTMDVDPERSWAIVRASVTYSNRPHYRQEFEFTYGGSVQGRPALRRYLSRAVQARPDGQVDWTAQLTTEVVKHAEETSFNPAEYDLAYYGLAPAGGSSDYWIYAVAGGLIVLVAGILFWLRRRRVGMSGSSSPA